MVRIRCSWRPPSGFDLGRWQVDGYASLGATHLKLADDMLLTNVDTITSGRFGFTASRQTLGGLVRFGVAQRLVALSGNATFTVGNGYDLGIRGLTFADRTVDLRGRMTPQLTFGFEKTAESDFDLKNRNDTADVDSKYLAAHATFGGDAGLQGAVGISYAWHDTDTTRAITGAPLAQTLVSQRDPNTLQIFGDISYKLMAGTTAVAPFVRVASVSTESDAVVERGGSAALILGRADRKTTYLSLGAKAELNAAGDGLQPFVSAAWNRAIGDRSTLLLSRFDAGGPSFAVTGQRIPRDSAELEAGLNYTSGALTIGAAYSGTLASERSSHGARATARLAF